MNRFDNGNPDSEHGFSSVAIMQAPGDYVIYNLPALTPGTYKVSLNYKLSLSKRGSAQFYINGTAMGDAIDQSASESEQMLNADLGTCVISSGDGVKLKMELVDGGKSGTGTYIGANYIVFTPANN